MALAQASPVVVHFGAFEADLRAGELRRNGAKVRIQDLPFRALAVLLSRPHQVVTREELRQELWPGGVFVDFDRSISTAIKRLRDALGDSADNPLFVETIERHGYRWIGPVQDVVFSAEAGVQSGGQHGLQLVAPPPPSAPRWKFVFVLPALALLFAAWMFRPSYRSAKAESRTQPNASSTSTGVPAHAVSREAEEFYLQGRYYWEKRTPDSLNKAVDSFMQAIVHDPGYAPAYVGLADCYNLLREYTVMPASEAYPRALAAAKKAVELEGRSSEAHASLAFASFFGMWDAATADREFRRAIDLNPNNAIAHHWYATYLQCLRRYGEALSEIERARALEPASKSVLADKGAILFDAGRLKEAIELLRQMEESEPDFISPHRYLKVIYLLSADYPHYLVEARSEAVLMHDNSALAIVQASEKGFANGGGKDLLKTLRQQQTKLYQRGQLSPYFLAVTCSVQGNKQEALRYLKIAYDQRADGLFQIETDHAFNNLHNEPAFRQLVADVGLPPLSEENPR
jgi:DNA-binding winged helix-turn-helix (wHTH) protein/tetratricopeptide (TPR) repeat protein